MFNAENSGNITDRPVEDGHLPVSNGVDALKSPFPLIYQTSHILHCFMCSTHPCIITEEKNKLFYDPFELHTHTHTKFGWVIFFLKEFILLVSKDTLN